VEALEVFKKIFIAKPDISIGIGPYGELNRSTTDFRAEPQGRVAFDSVDTPCPGYPHDASDIVETTHFEEKCHISSHLTFRFGAFFAFDSCAFIH
jgi:hypothetical protein